ncbi:MAG: hemolysin family protein [Bacteroidetes bacterium]|nr:hemolysin family protein [Bacteroidota bacterium]
MDNWLIVIITLLLSAFFSGMETAFSLSNSLKIEIDKSKGLLPARIISFLNSRPSRFTGTILLGNDFAIVVGTIALAGLLESLIPYQTAFSWVLLPLQIIVAFILIILLAEFLPKILVRINPNAVLNIFAIPFFVIYILFCPLVLIFNILGKMFFMIIFREKPVVRRTVMHSTDLDDYLQTFAGEQSQEGSSIPEIQMFQNAIEFRDVKIRECMVPRTDIEAIEVNDSIDNLRKKFSETGFSKIPVFQDSIDNIIGYTHHSDLFHNPQSIARIIRSLNYIPETMLANEVLSMFIREHKSIAVVVDEFGGTSGMVTMEDIIEEIFGEIEDEYDEEDLVEKDLGNGEYLFSGRLEIDYLNEKYNLNLPESEDYETLAGLILRHHESIPGPDEKIIIGDMLFHIVHSSRNRIDQVHLKSEE